LFSGESFANIKELKRILVRNHTRQFYRTLAEKLLIYALGRGLDYYDVETVDQLVERLEKADGRAWALLLGVVESAPFQRRRPDPEAGGAPTPPSHGQQAQARQTYENQ
jgi:transcription elongation factor GreA-like protein